MNERTHRRPPWLWIVAVLLVGLALFRGFRWPGLWAITHYCFSYETGFIKRGLLGATLRLMSGSLDYWALASVALGILGLLLAMLFLLHGRRGLDPAGLVLFSAPGFVFLVHGVAYLDQIMLLGVLVLILLRERLPAAVFEGLLLTLFGVLMCVHEASALIVGPLFGLLLHSGAGTWRRRIGTTVVLIALMGTALLLIRSVGHVSIEQARTMHAAVSQEADFEVSRGAFRVLTRSFATNREFMHSYPLAEPLWNSLLAYGPATLLLTLGAVRAAVRRAGPPVERAWFAALTVLACLSPLLLNVVGSDTYRWSSLTTVTAFLAWAAWMPARSSVAPERPWFRLLIAAVVVVNLFLPNHFFDGLHPRALHEFGEVFELLRVAGTPAGIPPI